VFRIRLAKENFKFSCSHFTIFGPNTAESLHGHNYYISAELALTGVKDDLGMAFDFNDVKPLLRSLADHLDEKVLLPAKSKYLKTSNEGKQVVVTFDQKTYSFPESDVLVLPLVNITSEELARHFAESFVAKIKSSNNVDLKKIRSVSIGIEETRGQTVFYDLDLV
jgi:6-pyruvoyltetrahydropterin/6-carboxytetrahydropterin synthase